MKPEQIYQELRDLAEKLGIKVAEKSFRNIAAGIHFQSGLCKIREKDMYIMDRNLPLSQKNELLAECLAGMEHENIYMVPALREFLDKHCRHNTVGLKTKSQTENPEDSQSESLPESQTENSAESQSESLPESQTENPAESQTESLAESQSESLPESQTESLELSGN